MSRPGSGASARVGMVGGGQLARMTHQAAVDLDVELVVLAQQDDEPAALAGARTLIGRPDDPAALAALAAEVDVVTFDHEHVPATLANQVAQSCPVRPSAAALRRAQDKLVARRDFHRMGLPVPAFEALEGDQQAAIESFAADHGWPVVIKACRGGYDGRGVAVVAGPGELAAALRQMSGTDLLVEEFVAMEREVAVVGARSPSGQWVEYPLVGTRQVDGICVDLVMPAPVEPGTATLAQDLARKIAEGIDAVGIIAVEMFVTTDGGLIINEIALRPHNSGHATIEGAVTSQFHNHLRAVLDWPLGDTSMRAPAAAMVNILGPGGGGDPRRRLPEALRIGEASVHLYGKSASPGRKLGHVTAVGASADEALEAARRCADVLTAED